MGLPVRYTITPAKLAQIQDKAKIGHPAKDGRFLSLCRQDLVGKGETLESENLGVLVHGGEGFLHRLLVVAELVLLLHQGVLLQELLDTAVHDTGNHLHLGGKGSKRLGTHLGDDVAGLLSLLGSEPALGGIGLDVVFAVHVGGVDAGLLQL